MQLFCTRLTENIYLGAFIRTLVADKLDFRGHHLACVRADLVRAKHESIRTYASRRHAALGLNHAFHLRRVAKREHKKLLKFAENVENVHANMTFKFM